MKEKEIEIADELLKYRDVQSFLFLMQGVEMCVEEFNKKYKSQGEHCKLLYLSTDITILEWYKSGQEGERKMIAKIDNDTKEVKFSYIPNPKLKNSHLINLINREEKPNDPHQ